MSPRRVVLAGLLLAAAHPHLLLAQAAQPWNGSGVEAEAVHPARRVRASAVAAVALTVSDADRSLAFYRDVLTFTVLGDRVEDGASWGRLTGVKGVQVRRVTLGLGGERLELLEFLGGRERPAPRDARSNDRWFQHVAIIVRDMDAAYARLQEAGIVRVSPAPQTLPPSIPAAAGIQAFYFRDPDGHPLEILQFPPDKGDARWHRTDGPLFLGLDHTAIVVWDTERSRAFYERLLGLEAKGESFNRGMEQERLNDVPGAELRITGLRAASGPGVELLDYRHPRNGRPYPSDERADDLVHWQTRIVVASVDTALAVLRGERARILTPEPVPFDPAMTGYRRAALVRDPDGHAVELVER